jgi:hypothetical protein
MLALFPLALLTGCNKDKAADTGGASDEAEVELPTYTITSPERGAFLGEEDVALEGTAEAGSAALTSLELDGAAVELSADGSFSHALDPRIGLNIVNTRLEDAGGERAVDGRAFVWGPTYRPGDAVPGAVRMVLGPDLLDDGNPDVDDAATLAEILLADEGLEDLFVDTPLETEDFILTPTNFVMGDADVSLSPDSGILRAQLDISDLFLEFELDGVGWYSWLGTEGYVRVRAAVLEVDVALDAGSRGVEATAQRSDVVLQDYEISLDYFPDGWEDSLAGWTQGFIEESIEEQVAGLVGDLISGYLSGLAVETELGEEDPIRFSLELSDVDVDPTGLRLTMDAAAEAVYSIQLPANAGSPDTEDFPPDWPVGAPPFAVLVDDDFLNQVIFAFWATGILSLELTGDEMNALAGQELVPPLGPVEKVVLDFQLPPVMGTQVVEDLEASIALGEVRLQFYREDGQLLDFSLNLEAGAELTLEGDEFGVALDNRANELLMEVGVLEYDTALDPGDLSALMRLLIPPLTSQVAVFAPTFPPPTLALDEVLEFESLEGVELGLQDAGLDFTDEGWLMITGRLGSE